MRNRDKLARPAGTKLVALATQAADVPYWVTLTAHESNRAWRHRWYLKNGVKRKALRDFIRSLCEV